jgi:hypothetical protein
VRRIGWEFTEPSLVWECGGTWKFTRKTETALEAMQGRWVLVMLEREKTLASGETRDLSAEVQAMLRRFPEAKVARVRGFNAARSTWVELAVLRGGG